MELCDSEVLKTKIGTERRFGSLFLPEVPRRQIGSKGAWIALLVVQPMLYQRGHLQLHRTLGRWGVYLLTPAIVLCGLLMDRRMLRKHNAPPSIIDQLAFLDLLSLIVFPVLVILSIYCARNLQLHARYIVCTVILLMPPALTRALFFLPSMHSFQVNVNIRLRR